MKPRIPKSKTVNADLVLLYWQVSARIHSDILNSKRAGYGKKIFYALSRKLVIESGNGLPGNAKLQLGDCAARPNRALVFPNSTRGNRESSCSPHLRQTPFVSISSIMYRTSIRNNCLSGNAADFHQMKISSDAEHFFASAYFTIVAHTALCSQLDIDVGVSASPAPKFKS
jgi:hypothetical protein